MSIQIVSGDLLDFTENYICILVNCQNKVKGFMQKAFDKYPEARDSYINYCHKRSDFELLGRAFPAMYKENTGQDCIYAIYSYSYFDAKYFSYDALWLALNEIHNLSKEGESVSFSLENLKETGGNVNIIYNMIEEIFKDRDVFIYNEGEENA